MSRRPPLLPFLAVAALAWGLFAAAGLWFTARLEARLHQERRDELALVARQAADSVAGYLERVGRAVDSAISAPAPPGADPRTVLSERFRILSGSYPEVRSMVYVDADARVFTAAPGQPLGPTDLALEDVVEAPSLAMRLAAARDDELQVRVVDLTRYLPAPNRVIQTPALLYFRRVGPPDRPATVLVPYRLDFITEHLLRPLASPERRDLVLIDHRGTAVFSTVPELLYAQGLPTAPGDDDTPAPRFAELPGAWHGHPLLARLVPLEVGGQTWTVVVAGHDHGVWPGRGALLAPPLLGSLALVLLLCAVAAQGYRRTRRDLRDIQRLGTAVESSGVGIAVFDRGDRYVYVNPAYSAITGVPAEQVLGRRLATRSEAFEDPTLLERVLPRVRGGTPWSGQARLRGVTTDPVDPWRTLSFTVAPLWRGREFAGYVTTAQDVTAEARTRRQLEQRTAQLATAKQQLEEDIRAREHAEHEKDLLQQELRRSQTLEAVGQLAGGVAHDFNNILASIIGCLYAVQQRAGADPEVVREIDRVKELCKRGGELNRQLLAVGRRDTGPREPVDAGEFLANLGLLLGRTLPPTITLHLDVPAELAPIRGNRSNLLAAFLNLGLNARDAMPDGGRLEFRARIDPACGDHGCVVVEVEDTGTGIPAEIQERVFEPFFTTKTPGVGTGLGLATAHAAVEECGGTIHLRSSPGVGTRFTICLPVLERRLQRRDRTAAPVTHPATDAPILVIEDEPGIARMIRTTLEGAGYRVVTAATGAEALAALRDDAAGFGAVTLDLMLPEVSGTEVYRQLKALAPSVPVLAVTARDDVARNALRGVPLLSKPFTPRELLDALGAALARGRRGTTAPQAQTPNG